MKGILTRFIFAEEPGPTFVSHAWCWLVYGKVEVSRPDVPKETHFKGSQLQLIIWTAAKDL